MGQGPGERCLREGGRAESGGKGSLSQGLEGRPGLGDGGRGICVQGMGSGVSGRGGRTRSGRGEVTHTRSGVSSGSRLSNGSLQPRDLKCGVKPRALECLEGLGPKHQREYERDGKPDTLCQHQTRVQIGGLGPWSSKQTGLALWTLVGPRLSFGSEG